MTRKSGPPPIVYILLVLILAGFGYWYFKSKSSIVPPGTTVRIDGSTSMVALNQSLKSKFESENPGVKVEIEANGSDKGILALLLGEADIAAVSRPLTTQETSQRLVAQQIGIDEIAVVVGKDNPFQYGLTSAQLKGIFQGQINNWSAVGGPSTDIRVINRPPISGTHQAFKELVLKGSDFGTTPNVTTLQRDETTGLLRELKVDGIGYASASQVLTQQTVRVVAIDDIKPGQGNYPLQRRLYYVHKDPPSAGAKAFLDFATSP